MPSRSVPWSTPRSSAPVGSTSSSTTPAGATGRERHGLTRFNEKIVALNLLAPMLFSQAVHDIMQAQEDGGVIVNIASVSGTRANPKGVAYGARRPG